MALFLGPLRRHRLFLVVLAIPLLFFLFSARSEPPTYETQRTGGLGTNTWGDEDWADDHLVNDQLAPKPNPVKNWIGKVKGKSGKTVLVTGGAGSLAHAVIEKLVALKYTVHAADIVPQPITLPPGVIYHRVDVTGAAVRDLLAHTEFHGVLQFAAVSLEQWCAPKHEECARVNVDGTRALINVIKEMVDAPVEGSSFWPGKGTQTVPWVIYGSSVDVYGKGEGGKEVDERASTRPVTMIGKTKARGEDAIRDVFLGSLAHGGNKAHTNDIGDAQRGRALRGAILRFSEVYGYPRATNVPAAFIPRLLLHAVSSLPIQYSSDQPASDLLHVSDAVDAVIHVMDHLDATASTTKLDIFNIVKGGKRWLGQEVVDIARVTLDSLSPIRDIGDKTAPTHSVPYSNAFARDTLDWEPQVEFPAGLNMMSSDLANEVVHYTQTFMNAHCPQHASNPHMPAAPEDSRNRALYKLDKCVVNVNFNHEGWMHHLKCEDGRNCLADDKRVASYNWNSTVWIVHVVDKAQKNNGRATVRFEQENGMGWLGLRKEEVKAGGIVKWEMFQDDDPIPHIDTFVVDVAPDSSILRMTIPGRVALQIRAVSVGDKTEFRLEPVENSEGTHDMRLTMLCCQSEGDWPLLLDDHESADIRFGTDGQIAFNASRRLHLCERAYDARAYYATMVGKLSTIAEEGFQPVTTKPKRTTQNPDNWALKELRPCWNDCASPTVCIQTGNCRCVQADNCPRRRENPLIALGRGINPPAKRPQSALGSLGGYSKVLAQMVSKLDWRDVLLPEARDYLQAHPEFIKVHVVDNYPKQKTIEAADCHKLQPTHCFSADSIMYKAMRHLSVPADEADLVVLPVYQHCTGADFILHEVWHYAATTIKGIDQQTKPVSLMMTHDWGICLAFTWEIWESREKNAEGRPRLYPDPIMKNSLVFSVMGDWDSNCYRPAQDVVVPARTCLSKKLVERFPTVDSIQPVRDRPQLINWSGTFWGTGKSERLRLACHRGGVADEELVPGQGPQSVFYDWADYMTNLNSARFCPQPRGVAGWSPRVNDAIYAGCIPIFTAEGSHYPFASLLDWSQFSVRIHPTELDHIERILNDIPLERVEQMQANLVAIREAFLYATDENPEDELHRRGPMFFALHAAGMRLRTQYPDRHAK